MEKIARDAGITYQPATWTPRSHRRQRHPLNVTIQAGYEGTYANLAKFVNLLDKSPRFLIIESMMAAPQQTGQVLNVTIKVDTFVKEQGVDASPEPEHASRGCP